MKKIILFLFVSLCSLLNTTPRAEASWFTDKLRSTANIIDQFNSKTSNSSPSTQAPAPTTNTYNSYQTSTAVPTSVSQQYPSQAGSNYTAPSNSMLVSNVASMAANSISKNPTINSLISQSVSSILPQVPATMTVPSSLNSTGYPTSYSGVPAMVSPLSFAVGFAPIPKQPLSQEAWIEAFDLLKQNGSFVSHHVHLDAAAFANQTNARSDELESLNFVSEMSKRNGLKLFIVIDPLAPNRENLDEKVIGVGKSFGDASIQQAFKNFSYRVAHDYHPAYLALGSELNTYLRFHPEDTQNLINLYKETYDLVKQTAPNTLVTVTFQYELLNGAYDGVPKWYVLDSFLSKMDLMTLTTYPSPYFPNPDAIPSSYYSQLTQYTSKPVIVAESGWPSGGEEMYHGSLENQKRFVERFPDLISGLKVNLWIWWFLHDWDGVGYADFFKTMGLIKANGAPKTSWFAWQQVSKRALK